MEQALLSAIVGAFVGALASIWVFRKTWAFDRLRELRSDLTEIVDLRFENNSISPDDPHFSERITALNRKRVILLANANAVADRLSRYLTADDYSYLGTENLAERDYSTALNNFNIARTKADRSATNVITKHRIRCNLAYFYAQPSPWRDLDRVNSFYGEAVSLTGQSSDEHFIYLTGLTYKWWGSAQRRLGDPRWRETCELARAVVRRLPDSHRSRTLEIDRISRFIVTPQAAEPQPLPRAALHVTPETMPELPTEPPAS